MNEPSNQSTKIRLCLTFVLLCLIPVAFLLPAPQGPICISAQGFHVWIWMPWGRLS